MLKMWNEVMFKGQTPFSHRSENLTDEGRPVWNNLQRFRSLTFEQGLVDCSSLAIRWTTACDNWQNRLFFFQEFADYFARQLQSQKNSEHKTHTNATYTTDVDPFAEIIWQDVTSRALATARRLELDKPKCIWEKISAGAILITLLVLSPRARDGIFLG